MDEDKLQALSEQLPDGKDPSQPPLHLWHPQLTGDIDILIRRDGSWIHEGRPINRPELVRLFASILRREDDGEYYLLTPVEKWRLRVECLPLVVTDFEFTQEVPAQQELVATLNTGRQVTVNSQFPLYLHSMERGEGIPAIKLDYGLAALFNRASWYRLAELCEESGHAVGVWSAGEFWQITPTSAGNKGRGADKRDIIS
jgi:hypothetical protein